MTPVEAFPSERATRQSATETPVTDEGEVAMQAVSRLGRLAAAAHRWKNSHQFLGRYSVEKLYLFHDYQLHRSGARVAAVLASAPVPVLAVMLAMEAIQLGDPAAGLKHNGVTLFRSIASHTVMTFAMLLTVKRAIRLPDDGYSFVHMAIIAVLVGVALEIFWLPFMVLWRYPVPFRELLGLVPFGALLIAINWLFARDALAAKWDSLQAILPIMGAQLTLFYTFLGLSIGFAYVPLAGQTAMIILFPFVKVLMKKILWRFASKLDDISTDVTICMVEISGALYQTVCLQHVESEVLGVLIMVMDFLQAVVETLDVSAAAKQLLDLTSLANSLPLPPMTFDEDNVTTKKLLVLPGTIQIDGISVERRDQARVLEQSLQLLFSCEVLLFVEFMEVLMPFVYAVYVGVAWHLPNAKYNYVLMAMTQEQMVQAVISSLVYAFLEAISLAMMCWLMHRKYGVAPLYQLAFVLENYWMTLHGKLIGTFITIVNSATIHQGIDFTFKFQYGSALVS